MDLQITYIGHATVLIEIDGIRLLTDPLLLNRVVHLRRQTETIPESIYQNIDAALISHLHFDHLDIPSLKLLGKSTKIVVPHGAAQLLEKKKFEHVVEMNIDDTLTLGSVTIRATNAIHAHERHKFGPTAECLGYLIDGTHNVYFAGDTDLFPEMADLVEHLDVALLPIWGWGPSLGAGHMNPYRAAQAVKLLEPSVVVPIHWGTFYPIGISWYKSHSLTNPPHEFASYAKRLSPGTNIQIVPPGTTVPLPDSLFEDTN